MYDVRKCSNFILLHVVDQFSQHHLLKRLFLQVCIISALFCFSKLGTKIRSSQGVVEP